MVSRNEIVQMVAQRSGVREDKAREAVQVVMEHLALVSRVRSRRNSKLHPRGMPAESGKYSRHR
jgi:hypothetical protein